MVVARVRPSRDPGAGPADDRELRGDARRRNGARSTPRLPEIAAALSHLSATVLLPRREVIVRQMALPGVAAKDIEGAIRFQLDTCTRTATKRWCGAGRALAYGAVLVGIVRREAVERYHQLFMRSRHRGIELHILGGGGACGDPAERVRHMTAGSWR